MDSEERILIVDDDESSRRTLKLIFNKKNYNIETVGSGKEAIEKIKDKSFNIVFLDIKLPDMEGVELIKPLKELHPDIVVIMVTAYASMETAVRALNEGASAYIHKPLNIDEVLKTVDDVFEKQRLIKEKRQAEEALRASETKYRNVVEHSLQGFMILQDGRIILANKALARMSKYTRQELMDLSPEEVVNSIHPEDRAFVMENMQDHLQGNSVPKRSEHRRLRKDGIDYWVESFTELIEYEGRPTLQIALVDITDRKEAEEKIKAYTNNLEKIVEERTYELKLSESRYRGLYESSIDGIISMDMEERIVEYNQAFENMLGYPKRTVRRLNYRNLIPKKWLLRTTEQSFQSLYECGSLKMKKICQLDCGQRFVILLKERNLSK
jgi:PAS domain S-box-containing protein